MSQEYLHLTLKTNITSWSCSLQDISMEQNDGSCCAHLMTPVVAISAITPLS
jgi:hypothetical protein